MLRIHAYENTLKTIKKIGFTKKNKNKNKLQYIYVVSFQPKWDTKYYLASK